MRTLTYELARIYKCATVSGMAKTPKPLNVRTYGGLLRFRKGRGWASYDTWPDPGPPTLARFEVDPAGRVFVAELHISAPTGVDGTDLREIPLGAMTTAVNGPSVRDDVLEHIAADGPTFDAKRFGPVRRSFSELVEEWDERPDRPPRILEIPNAKPRPDEFYEQVAELYAWLAGPGGSRKPAVDIANDNDVPASTVHRWVREARNRGLLSPGQRGAAG